MEVDEQAETSKAGAKRMRQLLNPAKLGRPSRSAIHPTTSHLIHPSPSPTVAGHLLTPLFASRAPRPLPTPPVLTTGRELSISPTGDWVIIFHPNPPISNQASEGGTLAIYPSSILSPISTPTARTTIPLATFPLPNDVLAIHHLYQPRLHLPPPYHRAKARGPAPPAGYDASQGPALVVLTPTSLILLHPQATGSASPAYMVGMLTCPLHTRWHASPGGSMPPDTGWRVERGWMNAVGGDEGVWVGWGRKGEVGVIRAEVGMVDGKPFLRTTPMPALPAVSAGLSGPRSVQGISFFPVPSELPSSPRQESEENDKMDGGDKTPIAHVVGAALIISDSGSAASRSGTTRIEVVGFERREVELVEGFNEIGGFAETDPVTKSWDWFTMPQLVRTSRSPTGASTIITSLVPLPDVPPHTLALAIIRNQDGTKVVHLDLCPDGSGSEWRILGDGIMLDLDDGEDEVELVPSQAVQWGLKGIVAVVSGGGTKLVIMPSIQTDLADVERKEGEGAGEEDEVAMGVVLAIRQGVSYADVIRSAFGMVDKDDRSDLGHRILRRAYDIMQDDLGIDEGAELHRLQVAVYGQVKDEKKSAAAELVHLYEASRLFDLCAHPAPTGIAFDLDTVWSILPVAEWTMSVLAATFRSIVLYKGSSAWSALPPGGENTDNSNSRLLYILHPDTRQLVSRLLSQIQALKGFLGTLEEAILQPPSRYMPAGRQRDARATVLAKERGRDLGVREGVDVELWGKALEAIEDPADLDVSAYTTAYLTLNPGGLLSLPTTTPLLDALPSPSSLLLADTASSGGQLYDAITLEPLPAMGSGIQCNRCAWNTASLGSDFGLGLGMSMGMVAGMGDTAGRGEGWAGYLGWRRDREAGCGCGGTWVREGTVGSGPP